MKKEITKEIEKAEQQILGFYHCYDGGDIHSLCCAMGLTKDEFKVMMSNGMLSYLPKELGKEIVKYLKQ